MLDLRDATQRGRNVGGLWTDRGGGPREEVSWGSVPKVAVPPERLVVGRKGSVVASFKTPSCTEISLFLIAKIRNKIPFPL